MLLFDRKDSRLSVITRIPLLFTHRLENSACSRAVVIIYDLTSPLMNLQHKQRQGFHTAATPLAQPHQQPGMSAACAHSHLQSVPTVDCSQVRLAQAAASTRWVLITDNGSRVCRPTRRHCFDVHKACKDMLHCSSYPWIQFMEKSASALLCHLMQVL